MEYSKNGLDYRIKPNCPHVGSVPAGKCRVWGGVFLKDLSPYLHEIGRKPRKIPNGYVKKCDWKFNPTPPVHQFWVLIKIKKISYVLLLLRRDIPVISLFLCMYMYMLQRHRQMRASRTMNKTPKKYSRPSSRRNL